METKIEESSESNPSKLNSNVSTFDKLVELQSLLKKESALKELCNIK